MVDIRVRDCLTEDLREVRRGERPSIAFGAAEVLRDIERLLGALSADGDGMIFDGRFVMNLKLIVAILIIATVPATAQTPNNATKSHAQKVLKIISEDQGKTRTYCDMAKLFGQIEEADGKKDTPKTGILYRKLNELAKKLGPEYAALISRLPNVDRNSQDGQEISSTFEALDKLCAQ
ncbi:MAG: hypothetical protein WA366_16725 [Pseudolabrys sp.]